MGNLFDNPMTYAVGGVVLMVALGLTCCMLNLVIRAFSAQKESLSKHSSEKKEKRRETALLNTFTQACVLAENRVITSALGPQVRPVAKECVACFERPRQVLLPCGHCVLCEKCANDVLASTALCPNCRAPFMMFKKIPGHLPSFRHLPVECEDSKSSLTKFRTSIFPLFKHETLDQGIVDVEIANQKPSMIAVGDQSTEVPTESARQLQSQQQQQPQHEASCGV
eukprot:c10957_g1_i1.p1 GENE.c10957_g1_i1~~c10957_g1_i1.p1  ORF type:complete len:225 (+),score=36.39 c10957_g1_i1:202-876(+)